MDLNITLAVLVICALAIVDSQFINLRNGNSLNRGQQRGFGQNTGLSGNNLNQFGLQALNNGGLRQNQQARLRAGNQQERQQGLNANSFENAQTGRNLDFANSRSSQNSVALQFESNNAQSEDSAVSINEGARLNRGNQVQAVDNFAQENLLDAQSVNQGLLFNNNRLGLQGLQRNNLRFGNNIIGQDGTFFSQGTFSNLGAQPFRFALVGKKK